MNNLDLDYAFEIDRPRETAGWDAEGPQMALGHRSWFGERETLERPKVPVYVAHTDSGQLAGMRADIEALETAGFDIMYHQLPDGGMAVRMYKA